MCNLQEHSDRSAREHAAQRQEPIYTELAAEYGIDYQPPAVANTKSVDIGGFLPGGLSQVINTTGKPIVILPRTKWAVR